MSKRNYCSRCGLNMTPNIGKSNVQWMISNRITMCEECNPKLWEAANAREITKPRKMDRANS